MPVYEYWCDTCESDFTVLRRMSESHLPHECPDCGGSAERAMLTAPSLSAMPAAARKAHATNERASHAPISSTEYKERHGAGCSCCKPGLPKRATVTAPTGEKAFPTARPWMISH